MGAPPPGWRRLRRGRVALEVRADLAESALAAGLLDAGVVSALLAGAAGAAGRGPTALLTLPGERALVLRPLRHGGVLGPLLGERWLGLRRPRRELRVTEALRAAGAPVPRPALAVGVASGWPAWRAALATELVPGARDALAFLAERPDRARLARACAAAGSAVRRFHDRGGVHPDLHVKNLLVREAERGAEVIVIDLDRARVAPLVTPRERMRELMRLLRSLHKRGLVEAVGRRGVARFFAAYLAGDRALRRGLLAHRAREERRIARHARLWPAPAQP